MIYRKGKGHRVLVCPHCGVLATNGLLGKLAKGAIGLLPGGGAITTGLEVAGELFKGKEKTSAPVHGVMHKDRTAYNRWLIESAEG